MQRLKHIFNTHSFRLRKKRIYPCSLVQISLSTILSSSLMLHENEEEKEEEEKKEEEEQNENAVGESISFFSLYSHDINEAFFYVLLKPVIYNNKRIHKIDICQNPQTLIHTSPYPSLFQTFPSTIVFLQHTKYAQQLKKYVYQALSAYRIPLSHDRVLFDCSLHHITFHVQVFNDLYL